MEENTEQQDGDEQITEKTANVKAEGEVTQETEEVAVIDEEVESIFPTESEANLQFLLMSEKHSDTTSTETAAQQPFGIICTIHLCDSKSELKTHPFFYLQYVKDPGIYKALHGPEPEVIFKDDGQDKYQFMCEVMGNCFIEKFHRELLTTRIELKYFGLNSSWMRAMCDALMNNKTVTCLNLSRNWLTTDACFHLGELIMKNKTINEINLMGCQIGMEGIRRLVEGLELSKKIKVLNLENNDIRDEGVKILVPVFKNQTLEELNLSYNKLKYESGIAFAKNLEAKTTKLSELDFSWNFLKNRGVSAILKVLRKVKTLTKLNLSWNSLESTEDMGELLAKLLRVCKKLQFLDISHNLLSDCLVIVSAMFPFMPHVQHLKIGCNKISPDAADFIMENFTNWRIKMKILDMENTNVTPRFVQMYNDIKTIRSRKNTIVIYETVLNNYTIKGPDDKVMAFQRAQFLAQKKKKSFASFVLRCQITTQGAAWMSDTIFTENMKKEKIGLDKDLLAFLIKPFFNKKKGINIKEMIKTVNEIWPEATPMDDQPPKRPTPIIVEKPEVEEKEKKGKKKEKGGKKKK